MRAARAGQKNSVQQLLQQGADCNLQSPTDGVTALHEGAACGNGAAALEVIHLLLNEGGAAKDLLDHAGRAAMDVFSSLLAASSTPPTWASRGQAEVRSRRVLAPFRAFHPALVNHHPLHALPPQPSSTSASGRHGGPAPRSLPGSQRGVVEDPSVVNSAEFRMYRFKVGPHGWGEGARAGQGERRHGRLRFHGVPPAPPCIRMGCMGARSGSPFMPPLHAHGSPAHAPTTPLRTVWSQRRWSRAPTWRRSTTTTGPSARTRTRARRWGNLLGRQPSEPSPTRRPASLPQRTLMQNTHTLLAGAAARPPDLPVRLQRVPRLPEGHVQARRRVRVRARRV
jgi:hypothetical protein